MNPKSYLRTERALLKLKVFVIIFLHTLSTEREYRLGILSITRSIVALHLLLSSFLLVAWWFRRSLVLRLGGLCHLRNLLHLPIGCYLAVQAGQRCKGCTRASIAGLPGLFHL